MANSKISAKIGKDGKPTVVEYDLGGDTLESLTARFGTKVIFQHAKASIVVAAQGIIRGLMTKEKEGGGKNTPAEIQAHMTKWMPEVRAPAKSPAEKAKAALDDLSAEDRAALLKELTGKK